MALPPTIPTSFVPHLGNTPSPHRLEPVTFLSVLAYVLLGIVCAIAIGIFIYGRVLTSVHASKEAELSAVQATIDPATIETFVRLHNRLESSRSLLGAHPAFSKVFASFEKIIPMKTRFTSLRFAMQEDGSASVDGTGVAQSFNVLAATSQMFASDTRIKNAVFSNIRVNKDGSVVFSLSAKIDQKNIVFNLDDSAAALPLP
jgi:hypothetical protein